MNIPNVQIYQNSDEGAFDVNYQEVLINEETIDIVERCLFAIETMASMSKAEIKAKCLSRSKKIEWILEECDVMSKAIEKIKKILNES